LNKLKEAKSMSERIASPELKLKYLSFYSNKDKKNSITTTLNKFQRRERCFSDRNDSEDSKTKLSNKIVKKMFKKHKARNVYKIKVNKKVKKPLIFRQKYIEKGESIKNTKSAFLQFILKITSKKLLNFHG